MCLSCLFWCVSLYSLGTSPSLYEASTTELQSLSQSSDGVSTTKVCGAPGFPWNYHTDALPNPEAYSPGQWPVSSALWIWLRKGPRCRCSDPGCSSEALTAECDAVGVALLCHVSLTAAFKGTVATWIWRACVYWEVIERVPSACVEGHMPSVFHPELQVHQLSQSDWSTFLLLMAPEKPLPIFKWNSLTLCASIILRVNDPSSGYLMKKLLYSLTSAASSGNKCFHINQIHWFYFACHEITGSVRVWPKAVCNGVKMLWDLSGLRRQERRKLSSC